VNINKEATALVENINKGKRIIPTVIINGTSYTNPNNSELATALGINEQGVVQLFGAAWCPDCREAKIFLKDNHINADLIGAGIHFCATCDGAFYRDKHIIVIGGGNSALEEGISLAGFYKSAKIVNILPEFSACKTYVEKLPSIKNISTYMNKTSVEFIADEKELFKALRIEDNETKQQELVEADGVFIFIGLIPNTKMFKNVVELNERGFIKTSGLAETNYKEIFAGGDCRKGAIAQVAAATGEGVLASYEIRKHCKK